MTLPKWLYSVLREREVMATDPHNNDAYPCFMDLPGEIRNQIYGYLMYSELKSVTIVNCSKHEHFGGSVLCLPLFRICRQIRAETLSLLCATKIVKIMGIDTANTFFRLNSATIGSMKSMVLVQAASELKPASKDSIDRFFGFMAQAKALKAFRLEGVGKMISLEVGGEHWKFMKRVEDLGRGGEVEIQMRFGRSRQ